MIDVLLIGGNGKIGSGLRTYLPRLDDEYRVSSADLPGAPDHVTDPDAHREFVALDAAVDDELLRRALEGRDVVVYLARRDPLSQMNAMTDAVFRAVADVCPGALMIGSSSVHAVDAAYWPFEKEPYATLATREFNSVEPWPERLSATLEPCPVSDYGLEKAYVEAWCKQFQNNGLKAVAARWGGINAENRMTDEVAYFTVWCHQQDAARFVDACYRASVDGRLRSGAHYFVISDNTYNIFDIETARVEIGYRPQHDAENFYS